MLHHWGLDDRFTARTAFPVTLVGNQLLQPNGQIYDGGLILFRVNLFISTAPIALPFFKGWGIFRPGQGCPGGRAINPNAFQCGKFWPW